MSVNNQATPSDKGRPPNPGVAPETRRKNGSDAGRHLIARLHQCSGGDDLAFADLYDLTAARVYGLTLRVLRNSAHAEEVTQESYLEIWRNSAHFDPDRGSAIGWIMVIAHRRAVDRVRSEESRDAREEPDHRLTHVLGDAVDSTSRAVLGSIRADQVHTALSMLTSLQREAIELTYFGGYTNAQVAQLTGVPTSTTKSRLRSGLTQLRDLVEHCESGRAR